VDFLDSINDLTRQKEAEVRKETAENLDKFRKLQEEAEQKAVMGEDAAGDGTVGGGAGADGEEQVSWVPGAGRKRKKGKEEKEGVKGLKMRKTSSTAEDASKSELAKAEIKPTTATKSATSSTAALTNDKPPPAPSVAPSEVAATKPAAGLGLNGYSSDED